ncbi:anti-sigma F factor [Clostridium botulinum Af84]|nr:anti-sigma F factor [Clostridium botulinum Af84]
MNVSITVNPIPDLSKSGLDVYNGCLANSILSIPSPLSEIITVTSLPFISQLDPTIDEITDVKTAVSEAVTNSIIHGYENSKKGLVSIESEIKGREVTVIIQIMVMV